MSKKKNRAPTGPVRVVGYIRVSTNRQADEGHSLEAQRAKIEAYAVVQNLQIVAFEVDAGASASSLSRPGLQRALERLDTMEASGIVVTKLDRLTRSVGDLCSLVDTYFREDHALFSIGESIDTSTAGGRAMLNLLTVFAQWEREAVGERTSAVMQRMRERGEYTGGHPPYGFREVAGTLVPDDAEQVVIVKAKELRERGHTLRAIACHLGNNPRNGKPFNLTQIVRMM